MNLIRRRLALAARHSPRDAARGLGLAALGGGLACALALGAFRRPYYLAALMPLALTLYLLVAWFIHLGLDGFFRPARDEAGGGGAIHPGPYAPLDDRIVPRADAAPRRAASPEEREARARGAIRALIWAAAWLALASCALYRVAGVGAEYFPR
jgi:hypothetical protein